MESDSQQALLKFDKQHIWHPYTSAVDPLPTHLVKSAEGVTITLEDDTQIIDGMASWWCAIHGYNHPQLNKAAKAQLEKVSHVMFGGLTHKPAIELSKRLLEITPDCLQHVFLADSGSVSVEVAIKMAIQYWHAVGKTKKNKMLSLRGGYHGDTFAAMSVCDPVTGMHQLFNNSVNKQHFCERPTCEFSEPFDSDSTLDLQHSLEAHHQEIAAVILEPVVQGAGGMWFYHPQYLNEVRRLCDQYDVLLIADEIATGFGRTGKLFACEWAKIEPDILCLGKALTGGYLSLAATLTTAKVAKGISTNGGVFMHGPTFMGNPLACAIAVASIDLLLANDWTKLVSTIESTLREELSQASSLSSVENVRVLGAIGVIEVKSEVDLVDSQAYFVEQGVWVRPFGKLLYIMPPYIISTEDLRTVCRAMVSYAESLEADKNS